LASCASPGFPVLRVLWPRRATDSASCPASSVLWLCRRWIFELPRISHPSALPVSVIARVAPFSSHSPRRFDQGLRLPFVLDLRLCRRWIFESPRTSHPSAVPIDRLTGRPELRSLGIASDPLCELPRITNLPAPAGGLPSRPGSCTLRLCQRRVFGSPRFSFPLASPVVKLRVAPALRSSGSADGSDFQVALNLRSFSVADDWIGGSPRFSVLRRSVYASSGCPDSASHGWADDESLAVRELCILSLRRG